MKRKNRTQCGIVGNVEVLERTHDDVRQKSFEEVSNLLARCGKAGD
jgi:hypothetical protein